MMKLFHGNLEVRHIKVISNVPANCTVALSLSNNRVEESKGKEESSPLFLFAAGVEEISLSFTTLYSVVDLSQV